MSALRISVSSILHFSVILVLGLNPRMTQDFI